MTAPVGAVIMFEYSFPSLMRLPFAIVAWILPALTLIGCDHGIEIARLDGRTMGTTWSVQFDQRTAVNRDAIAAAIQAEFDRVIAQMSGWEPNSTLSRYNAAANDTWHELPVEFAQVLATALDLARATDGAYDPTVGPLVEVWGFGAATPRTTPPGTNEIEQARARVGWARLRFDATTRRLYQPGGLHLDLASIAEGYAVDRIGQALEGLGVTEYLAEIGGELRAHGRRPDGSAWRVAIERPTSDRQTPLRLLPLHDLAVSTSGGYRTYFVHQGRRYSHTIDPHTGWPVDHDLAAVTVVARDCMRAGSLATALSVLGPDRGLAYAEREGIAALFVLTTEAGLRERMTTAFLRLPSE